MKRVAFLLMMMTNVTISFSQVSINTDGSQPNPSAMLEVRIQQAQGKKLTITGFSGMKEEKLTELVLDKEGFAKYSGDYQGFALIEIENKGLFPVILGQETVKFSIDERGIPQFTDKENAWLYDALNRKNISEQKRITLKENLNYFREDDPYYRVLKRKQVELDSLKGLNENAARNKSGTLASLILQGRQVIESTYGIRTKEQLYDRKKAMLDYLYINFEKLYHTDMFRQIAFQYAMMNEYVAKSREEHYKYVIADIGDWITKLDGKLTPEEITEFFLSMAAGRRMISLGTEILGNFGKYTGCPVKNFPHHGKSTLADFTVHLWKSKETQLPMSKISNGKKLVIFYDEDCVFCLSGHVRMMNLLEKNGASVPVITVFTGQKSPTELEDLVLPRQFNYWYYDDPATGSKLTSALGIQKYPAFVVLDPANPDPLVFYTGDEAVPALVKPQK